MIFGKQWKPYRPPVARIANQKGKKVQGFTKYKPKSGSSTHSTTPAATISSNGCVRFNKAAGDAFSLKEGIPVEVYYSPEKQQLAFKIVGSESKDAFYLRDRNYERNMSRQKMIDEGNRSRRLKLLSPAVAVTIKLAIEEFNIDTEDAYHLPVSMDGDAIIVSGVKTVPATRRQS